MFLSGKIKVIKATDMKNENRLSTGSQKLDQCLCGGLPIEGIVELTGESGCGKSQLCKQLTLTVQYPLDQGGFEGGAIYICTEERFQSKRLYQLIESFPKRYYKCNSNIDIDFGNNILVVHVSDFENFEKCLKKVPSVIRSKNVKLIIVDSITAIFRGNYTASEWKKRIKELRLAGSLLHSLSANHHVLIVCVNQVSQSFSGKTVPALGLTWANIITARILLTRNEACRFFRVVFSPELPSNVYTDFSIEESGIH